EAGLKPQSNSSPYAVTKGRSSTTERLRCRGGAFAFSRCSGFRRRTLHTRGANLLDLFQALLLFVRSNSDELEHRLSDAQAAFQFVNRISVRGQREEDVLTILKLLHVIGQATLAHLLRVLHGSARAAGVVLQRADQLVHVFLQQVRPHNKHYFVRTLHRLSKSLLPSTWYLVFGSRHFRKTGLQVPIPNTTYHISTSAFLGSLAGFVLAVKPVHGRRNSFANDHVHGLRRHVQRFVHCYKLRLAERREDVLCSALPRVVWRDSDPYTGNLFGLQRIDDGLHSVVPGGRAALSNPNHSQRQVQFVIDDDQVLFRIGFILSHQLQHRHAAQVHVGLRLGQKDLFIPQPASAGERLAVPVVDRHAALLGDPVNRQKADVVRRELILDTGIAQPDDQLHAAYFFAGAGSPSPWASCFPFLMTSGSAGAAAAPSTAASAAGAT